MGSRRFVLLVTSKTGLIGGVGSLQERKNFKPCVLCSVSHMRNMEWNTTSYEFTVITVLSLPQDTGMLYAIVLSVRLAVCLSVRPFSR